MTVTRFQQKRGTSAQWAASTTPLRDGEIGIDKDTGLIKVGDGLTLWPQLPAAFSSQYLPLLGKANDSYKLDGLASSDFLRSTGKAVSASDSDKLGGQAPGFYMPASAASSFLPTSAAASFLAATGKAADADKLDGLDSLYFAPFATVDDRTLPASANRKLIAHWGSGTSFPVVGVLQGDTFVRSDLGTSGSLWTYVGAGKGSNGWVHKGLLVCTSTTHPTVTYGGLEIFESDTRLVMLYDGAQWSPMTSQWSYTLNNTTFTWGVPISPQKLPGSLGSPIYVPPGRSLELELRIPQVALSAGANGFIQIAVNPNVTGNVVIDGVQMSESTAATGGQSLPAKLSGSWANTATTTATCDIFAQAWSNSAANTLFLNAAAGANVVFRTRIV